MPQGIGPAGKVTRGLQPSARRPACRRRPSIGRGAPRERVYPGRGDRCTGRDAFVSCSPCGLQLTAEPSVTTTHCRPSFGRPPVFSPFPFRCCCIRRCLAVGRRHRRDNVEDVVVTANRIEQHASRVGDSVTVISGEGAAPQPEDGRLRSARDDARRDCYPQWRHRRHDSLRIRGAETDQTVVLIDGVKLNDPSTPAAASTSPTSSPASIRKSKCCAVRNPRCGAARRSAA